MNVRLPYIFILIQCLIGLLNTVVYAQYPQNEPEFGKNRFQYRDIEWKYFETEHFGMYYYDSNEEFCKYVAGLAEAFFKKTTHKLGYYPYGKIHIFLYEGMYDLHQSNIGITQDRMKLGGQTSFGKNTVEIAFDGSIEEFKSTLWYKISQALILDILYGGNLKDMLQSALLLKLPEWYINGLAAYLAYGLDEPSDDFIRKLIIDGKLHKPDNFKGLQAEKVGQCIWAYVELEYGQSYINSILSLTRLTRNERNSFENALRISYEDFLNKYTKFYQKQFTSINSSKEVFKSQAINTFSTSENKEVKNHIVWSPDGLNFLYALKREGIFELFIQSLDPNTKPKKVFRGGRWAFMQDPSNNIPLFQFRSKDEIWICYIEKGKWTLVQFSLSTNKVIKENIIDGFQSIHSFSIHPNKQKVILSATKNFQNDLYEWDVNSGVHTVLTNSPEDELMPVYSFDGSKICYTSNLLHDSLKVFYPAHEARNFFNIFELDIDTKIVKEITYTDGGNDKPQYLPNNDIVFLSGRKGIMQLFRYNRDIGTQTQISDNQNSIQAYHIHDKKCIYTQGNQLVISNIDLESEYFTNSTDRKQLLDFIAFKRRQSQKLNGVTQKVENNTKENSSKINTDSYRFDTFESIKEKDNPSGLVLTEIVSIPEIPTYKKSKTIPYYAHFALDHATTSFLVDPFRGFGLLFETGMTDELENHKITAGMFNVGIYNLENGVMFADYLYLKKRLDYGLRFDRKSFSYNTGYFSQKYILAEVGTTLSYPISTETRVMFRPSWLQTSFQTSSELDPAIQAYPIVQRNYLGTRLELVYDHSIPTLPNLRKGVRASLFMTPYFALNNNATSFSSSEIDVRAYVPLKKYVYFASRLAFGKYISSGPKYYRLGGMNNWIFQKEDISANEPFQIDENDPESYKIDFSDILFTRYVGPMRGFNNNKLSGKNYLLLNFELRMPIVQLFDRKSIKSKFFSNLQLIAFSDIGSAWTGISPFQRQNALNTVDIVSGPFYARVSNFKDPFLIGYGGGVRTKIFNYYTRFDVAWSIEDKADSKAKFYFSIGYDF